MSDKPKNDNWAPAQKSAISNTFEKAWGFWESAQKQAQETWNSVDSETLKQKIGEFGRTAGEYIDQADRKIEEMENEAKSFIQQSSNAIAEKVKEATYSGSTDGKVIFDGPEGKPVSRLDSELMSLNRSPLKILECTKSDDILNKKEKETLLKESKDLKETFNSLVPAKLNDEEFWLKYGALRAELLNQDERRKELIGKPGQQPEEDDLDDWGSSENE